MVSLLMSYIYNSACSHCKTDFFEHLYSVFCHISTKHLYFNFLFLIFPKPFHFLVTVFSTPSFSVCFYLGIVSPSFLQTIHDSVPSHFTFSFILHPQGGTVPPPTSHRSLLPQLLTQEFPWECWRLQYLPPVTNNWRAGKSNGLPTTPPVPPTAQIFLLEDICISRVSSTREVPCPPVPHEKQKILTCLTWAVSSSMMDQYFFMQQSNPMWDHENRPAKVSEADSQSITFQP